ncbi:hypothetical protein LIMNO130_60095 [Limnobacter sp. 130]|nr:hypothetical protein LIMNO130_60095 [Limnobacter sp. 130]
MCSCCSMPTGPSTTLRRVWVMPTPPTFVAPSNVGQDSRPANTALSNLARNDRYNVPNGYHVDGVMRPKMASIKKRMLRSP